MEKKLPPLLGLLAMVFGSLGFVFLVFFPLYPNLATASWGMMALFLLVLAFLERASLLHFFQHRTTRYGLNISVTLLLILVILGAVNYFAYQHRKRFDLTGGSRHSLSEQTIKILAELSQPLRARYFYGPGPEFDRTQKLLDTYRLQTKNWTFETFDINRSPGLAKGLGVTAPDTLVLQLGEDSQRKTVKVSGGVTEEKLTNAILRLLKSQNQIIYVLTGHGERSLDSQEGDANGVSVLRSQLELEAYQVKPLTLENSGQVPEDASAVLILGPQSQLLAGELEALEAYRKRGGRLVIALDPIVEARGHMAGAKQIAAWLEKLGLVVADRLLVDSSSRLVRMEPQVLVSAADSADHPVSKDFPRAAQAGQFFANFYMPFTGRVFAKPELPEGTKATSLAVSTPTAWEESDWQELKGGSVRFNDGSDFRGAMSLAMAFESTAKDNSFRMVVFPNSTFLANGVILQKRNRDLILNSVAWLTGQDSQISIRNREAHDTSLAVDGLWLTVYWWLGGVLLPVFLAVFGGWVWFRRRGA